LFNHYGKKKKLFREYWRGALWAVGIHLVALLVLALIADRIAEVIRERRAAAAASTASYADWANRFGGDSIVFMEIPPLPATPTSSEDAAAQPLLSDFERLLGPLAVPATETAEALPAQ
jgi:hypothetical protein